MFSKRKLRKRIDDLSHVVTKLHLCTLKYRAKTLLTLNKEVVIEDLYKLHKELWETVYDLKRMVE